MTSYHKKQEPPIPSDYKYPPRTDSQTTKQRNAMSQYASKTKTLESSEPESELEPAPTPAAVEACTDWKEDEEHEVDGIQRKVQRYRMIKELYAATEKVVPASSGGRKQKEKKK